MKRFGSLLLWSVIAAAFIGPGTVTTCAAAGAGHGTALLWALTFSAFGCFVLQEAAARVTIVSGRSLAEAMAGGDRGRGGMRWLALLLVGGAIVVGCAAYEAGNMLGAVAGATLETAVPAAVWTVLVGLLAGAALWFGSADNVSRGMGLIVAAMGIAFAFAAIGMRPDAAAVLTGALVPRLPAGTEMLAVGLIGTTIVPYNLFLGSGLARGRRLEEVRPGLAIAVGLGAAISMAVVVVGGAVEGPFGFPALRDALVSRLGAPAGLLFAAGLFFAGFSSAVTAPLAAAITARGLATGREVDANHPWGERGLRYRAVWIGVLAAGWIFGLSGIRPVPVILLAQALNGLLLPIAAGYLVLVVNDRAVMGSRTNGLAGNLGLAFTFLIATTLGTTNLLRAAAATLGLPAPPGSLTLLVSLLLALCAGAPLASLAARKRR